MKQVKRLAAVLLAVLMTALLSVSSPASFATDDKEATKSAEAATINKKDGNYTVKVTLSGGDVEASLATPVFLRVENKQGLATVVWQNVEYDALVLDGEEFLPLETEDESCSFELPVTAYDKVVKVTAMNGEEATEYGLTFSSSGIHKVRTPLNYLAVVGIMFLVMVVAVLITLRRKK